jgi:nitroreductase
VLEYRRDVRTLVRERTSVRTYKPEPIPPAARSALETACRQLATGPLGTGCRFLLLDRTAAGGPTGAERLGTYGVIRGASTYLAGAASRGPCALLDFGYLFELLILRATDLGLGTCWLGGTFRRSDFDRALRLREDEILPAVSPVGMPAGRRSLLDHAFRIGAGSRSRRPWESLYFNGGGKVLSPGHLPDSHRDALEMLRLAPSASNRQPWRGLLAGRELHLFLHRTPGYRRAGAVDLQQMDIGIAMAHFELALRAADPAEAAGGRWLCLPELPGEAQRSREVSTFQNLEYVVSWRAKG